MPSYKELQEVNHPAQNLEEKDYIKWFIANGWSIELVEYKDTLKPTLVKELAPGEPLKLSATEAAKELCGLEIRLSATAAGDQQVKILTNMSIEGHC